MKIKIKRDLTLIRRIEYQTMVVNNVTIIFNINLIVKKTATMTTKCVYKRDQQIAACSNLPSPFFLSYHISLIDRLNLPGKVD